jgi:hypothetical protein
LEGVVKAKVLGAAAALALLGVSQASANTIYAIHDTEVPFTPFSVDGTITTDGTVVAAA